MRQRLLDGFADLLVTEGANANAGNLPYENDHSSAGIRRMADPFHCRGGGKREKIVVIAGCDEGQSGVGVLVPESAQCRCHNNIRRTQQHSGMDDEVNDWVVMSVMGVASISLLTKGTATGQGSAWCVPKSRGGPMS